MESPKQHILSQHPSTFKISSFAQEMMCYAGQQMVFLEASDMLEIMKGVDINAKQIERVCHHYGGLIETDDVVLSSSVDEESSPHYAMIDGSMLLTREEKWKEVKMARLFKASDNIEIL